MEKNAMKNAVHYEYRAVNEDDMSGSHKGRETNLCIELGKMSAEGWEVVCTVPSSGNYFRVLLRREVKPTR